MAQTDTIIGIAGASGAGKSLLAHQLFDQLRINRSHQDVMILNEDSYYRERSDLSFAERETINYDHPEAFEHELLIKHLADLRQGNSIDVPQYDYALHNRKPETMTLEPSRILILEGILLLHSPELRDQIDLKVYVDVPMDICLARRMRRDINERERSLDSVLSQYESTVRPMFYQFIDPTKNFADIIVPRGGENLSALGVLFNHLDRILSR